MLFALVKQGLGIGIAISEVAGQLADAIMVALAAGTFIYVGATEVIAEEFESPHDKWKKFFALSGVVSCHVVSYGEISNSGTSFG